MNRLAGMTFSLILLAASVSSCSSMGRSGEQPTAVGNQKYTEAGSVRLPSGWKYETEITHKGSRSEGSVSRLFYRYNEVPPVFNYILIGDRVFEYVPMKNLWDNWGYIGSMLPSRPECTLDDPVSSDELHTGWYTDPVRRYKAGTPASWIYIEAAGMKAWCAPEKIPDFVEHFGLDNIHDGPSLMLQE